MKPRQNGGSPESNHDINVFNLNQAFHAYHFSVIFSFLKLHGWQIIGPGQIILFKK